MLLGDDGGKAGFEKGILYFNLDAKAATRDLRCLLVSVVE